MLDPALRRIKDLIEKRGLTHQDVSTMAGLSKSAVNSYIKKGSVPGGLALMGIAKALGTSVDYLLTGQEPDVVRIPVVGIASAGEGWTSQDGDKHDPIAFDLESAQAIAIEVRGDSMSPVYRDGDFLVCDKRDARYGDNLIGQDCAVMTKDGDGYVKILKRGTMRGRFNLKSYNALFNDIENVELRWIAPILWVKRGHR